MVDTWLEADIVIDVANLSNLIKEEQGAHDPILPSLALLSHTLRHYGVRVRSLVAALPTLSFVGAGRTDRALRDPGQSGDAAAQRAQQNARANIGTGLAWVATQRRDMKSLASPDLPLPEPRMLRIVDGATIGRGERGVDELAAMAALDLLWRLPQERTDDGLQRGVLLVSRDRDVEVCHHIASGRPLFGLGIANRAGRERAEDLTGRFQDGYGHLLVPRPVLRRLGIAGIDPITQRTAYTDAVRDAIDAIDKTLSPLAAERRTPDGAPGGRLLLAPAVGEDPKPVSSPLPAPTGEPHEPAHRSWEARRRRATAGRRTVCVADPVGLQRTGARALGLAGLPGPDTLHRLVVDRLGFPVPMGLLCTVADTTGRAFRILEQWVKEHADELGSAGERYLQAVKAADGALDELAAAMKHSGAVDRGMLDLLVPGKEQPSLRRLRLEEKEVTVLLAADVLWTLLHTGADVALVTDRSELQYLLENLPSIPEEADRKERLRSEIGARVTRIGLHADPFATDGFVADDHGTAEPVPLPERPAGLPHEVALDGALAADLLGIEGRLHGPALEATVHQMLEEDDVVWQAVESDAGDPWERGLLVRAVNPGGEEERELEMWLDRGLLLSDEIYELLRDGVRLEDLPLAARIDPTRPCAVSRLQRGEGRWKGMIAEAVILGPTDGGTIVDMDGDETTIDDRFVVPAGHGYTDYRPGMRVVVIWDDEQQRVLRLLGPDPDGATPTDRRFDGLPVVGTVTGPRAAHASVADDEARELALHAVPSMRWSASTPDARVLVVPTSDTDAYLISSALPHLQVVPE